MNYRRYSFLLRSKRHARTVLLALIACLGLSPGAIPFAEAATFTVDRTDDEAAALACDDGTPNDCSLRGAISQANGRSEASTIIVPAGTYVLSQLSSCTYSVQPIPTEFFTSPPYLPLCLSKQVTIQGAGAATTIIDGGRRTRVLFVSASAVAELRGVTITNGLGSSDFGNPRGFASRSGGGILNEGTLTLTDSVVRNNSLDPTAGATGGAGIYNTSVVTLLGSTVSDNFAPSNDLGGGILNDSQATLTVNDSTISNNSIGGNGGGICNFGGATLTNSTVSGNTADGFAGGGIANFGGNFTGTLTVVNSTISGNTSGSSGGGIFSGARTEVRLNNVTITGNVGATDQRGSGGGVTNEGMFTLQNTIIAGNTDTLYPAGSDCTTGTTLISQGHNLLQNISQCTITGDLTGNLLNVDPQLGVLLNNGGFTKTHALSEGSPAIDAGNPAAPGSGGAACAAIDQRGFLRPLGTPACDIGAFERGKAFSVAQVLPNTGGNTGAVSAFVAGNGFVDGATVKLTRAGQPDIVGNPVQVDAGGSAVAVTFDLVGRSVGPWDVVVRNPDGTSKMLAAGFAIEAGRAPELWVDVIARSFRDGRPSRQTILYGNRGNVDALAVPLSISISSRYGLSAAFAITSPPPQAGQINVNWSQVPVIVQADAQNSSISVPLLLPVVPAGFTGSLQIVLLLPPAATASTGFVGIDSPYFNPILDPQIVSGFVQGAQAYAQQGFAVTIPPALVPDLEEYVTNQLQLVVNNGRNAWVANLGTFPQVYSLSQLQLDTALFGARLALTSGQASAKPQGAPNWLSTAYHLFVSLVSQLGPAEAQADCPVYKKGDILRPGCTGGGTGDEIVGPPPIPPPPGCDPDKIKEKLKTLTGTGELLLSPPECKITPAHCEGLPGYHVITYADGTQACVPNKCTNTSPINGDCRPYPIDPKKPRDPNDKAGSLGVTPAQFLLSATPLSYAIHFENLATATAAAQEVVITDQLDVQTLDLDTFRLGPLSFGGDSTQALISLKGQGQCEIELPEALFDTDYPGHYMRRVKSVSLTIPAVVGPYAGVNCTLTLLRDKTRVKSTPVDGYPERDGEEDDRFVTNWAPLQAIATSTGQNDAGLFELNFRDERYLPFEGAGAVSRWRIELDPDSNGFDFNTLSDVVLHIRYTAREGGERLKRAAKAALAQAIGEEAAKPQARLFSLKHEFPTEWYQFTRTVAAAVGTFTLTKERFPFLFRGKTLTAGKVSLYAVLKHGAEPASSPSVVLTPPGGKENPIEFELRKKWREILAPKNTPDVETEITATPADSKWVLKTDSGDLAKNVDDLLLMCEYTVELNR